MKRKKLYKVLLPGTIFLLVAQASAFAQEASPAQDTTPLAKGTTDDWLFWGMSTLALFVLFLTVNVLIKMRKLTEDTRQENAFNWTQWWTHLNSRVFTKAVPVEKEEDILLDHDYDGIKELDNALPPWWKWGFYITIVVAVFYILRFHVWGTGPTPEQEYEAEMTAAAAQLEEFRKMSNDMVDVTTVVMADAAGIADGKQIFQKSCFMCHGNNGEGSVGPNLTDDYWLHGGSINDIFKTIKYGVPDKGMQAWEKTFSPAQIKNLSSYVKSLRGTNPANAKAPQGDLFAETIMGDSTAKPGAISLN